MSHCSLNTPCHLDQLVSAIQDVSDAFDEEVLDDSLYSRRFFSVHYPRLTDAIAEARLLIDSEESGDHRNRLVGTGPLEGVRA